MSPRPRLPRNHGLISLAAAGIVWLLLGAGVATAQSIGGTVQLDF
jgi:hypothetical protein